MRHRRKHLRRRRSTLRRRDELLLHANYSVAMPLLDRNADRIRNGQNLVGSETDRAIRRDAAQLPVNLHDRNAGPERERDQTTHRLRVGHRGTARLAEREEDLERLTLL